MAVDKFEGTLAPIAEHIFGMKDIFLNLCKKYQTPFYAYDSEAIDKSATRFFQAFNSNIPKFKYYYSVKINSYEKISSRIISLGAGLEIASLRELSMALESGCKDLLYYSPGKTSTDLKEIINHRQKIILHIDSFSELNRIASLLSSLNSPLRAAVRINFTKCNNWSKYGIPLDDLLYFYECANKISGLDIQGIHFHTSRNLTAEPYVQSIKKLGMYISENFSDPLVKSLKYIDFGGGI